MRDVSDMSAVADGLAVYNSNAGGWVTVGGTSASSPLVAAIYATARHPAWPGDSYFEPDSFYDITSGSNVLPGDPSCTDLIQCNARGGWDGPTGIGSPIGSRLAQHQIAVDWVAISAAIL